MTTLLWHPCVDEQDRFLVVGFSGGSAQLGVRTTKAVKKIGCSNLKQMVEDNKLIVEDYDAINELSTFIVKGQSYEADDGCNDDLVACLFIFAWMTDQQYFKELTDSDIRKTMMREQQDALEQDMAPFGFVVNGLEDENIGEMVDEYMTRWTPMVETMTVIGNQTPSPYLIQRQNLRFKNSTPQPNS